MFFFLLPLQKPADICKMIGLCSSAEEREKMLSYFVNQVLQANVKSDNVSKYMAYSNIMHEQTAYHWDFFTTRVLCLSIRGSRQHIVPSVFSSSRLWKNCCPKKGLR